MKFFCLVRQTQCLSVALRVGHGEIRGLILLEIASLDLCQNRHRQTAKPSNAAEIFAKEDVDGGLIGGAALKAEDFLAIGKGFEK